MYGIGELEQENLVVSAPNRAAFIFTDTWQIHVRCVCDVVYAVSQELLTSAAFAHLLHTSIDTHTVQ